jgi:hypothetical protein
MQVANAAAASSHVYLTVGPAYREVKAARTHACWPAWACRFSQLLGVLFRYAYLALRGIFSCCRLVQKKVWLLRTIQLIAALHETNVLISVLLCVTVCVICCVSTQCLCTSSCVVLVGLAMLQRPGVCCHTLEGNLSNAMEARGVFESCVTVHSV